MTDEQERGAKSLDRITYLAVPFVRLTHARADALRALAGAASLTDDRPEGQYADEGAWRRAVREAVEFYAGNWSQGHITIWYADPGPRAVRPARPGSARPGRPLGSPRTSRYYWGRRGFVCRRPSCPLRASLATRA
jgi:hypothetical protein